MMMIKPPKTANHQNQPPPTARNTLLRNAQQQQRSLTASMRITTTVLVGFLLWMIGLLLFQNIYTSLSLSVVVHVQQQQPQQQPPTQTQVQDEESNEVFVNERLQHQQLYKHQQQPRQTRKERVYYLDQPWYYGWQPSDVYYYYDHHHMNDHDHHHHDDEDEVVQQPNNNDNKSNNNQSATKSKSRKICSSIRQCFVDGGYESHGCINCYDNPKELEIDLSYSSSMMLEEDQSILPDPTMLHTMLLNGYDSYGYPFPPYLSNEYCENINDKDGSDGSNNPNNKHVDDHRKLFLNVPIIGKKLLQVELQNRNNTPALNHHQQHQDDDEITQEVTITTTTTTTTHRHQQQHNQTYFNDTVLPKLFCGIYTMKSEHGTRVRSIRETWGPYCNGFLGFSTLTDLRIPTISIPHDGIEEYQNMYQKVRSIWNYIAKHYLDDYDYFILGGDDLFLIPTNLRYYLYQIEIKEHEQAKQTSRQQQQTTNDTTTTTTTTTTTISSVQNVQFGEIDLFLGRRLKSMNIKNHLYFNSGGPGYVLSRSTLRKLYQYGLDHPICTPTVRTSKEDVKISECLYKLFQIGLTDTRDSKLRERFHQYPPAKHLNWKYPKQYLNNNLNNLNNTNSNNTTSTKHDNPKKHPKKHKQKMFNNWYANVNREWGLKTGLECCASDSISFHYIKKPALMRHLHSLLYHC